MARYYLAADARGRYKPQYRADFALDCVGMAGSWARVEWPSVFTAQQHAHLVSQSIPVVIPELGLAGVREFSVEGEVPRWWLYGPNGREVLGLLRQYLSRDVMSDVFAAPTEAQQKWRTLAARSFVDDVVSLIDGSGRTGAYLLASRLTREGIGPHGRLASQRAFESAVGMIVRDLLPEASVLYEPWTAVFGWPRYEDMYAVRAAAYPTLAYRGL